MKRVEVHVAIIFGSRMTSHPVLYFRLLERTPAHVNDAAERSNNESGLHWCRSKDTITYECDLYIICGNVYKFSNTTQ